MNRAEVKSPRLLEIRREIAKLENELAAIENECDADDLTEEFCYIAEHIAVLADAAQNATGNSAKDSLAIIARDMARSLAERLDVLAMQQGARA